MLFRSAPVHLLIRGRKDAVETKKMLDTVRERFVPQMTLGFLDPEGKEKNRYFDFARSFSESGTAAEAFLCVNYECSLPVTDAAELNELLDEKLDAK